MAECPKAFIGPDVADACRAADWVTGHKVLPEPGGLLDQSDTFVEFLRVLHHYEAEADESKDKR